MYTFKFPPLIAEDCRFCKKPLPELRHVTRLYCDASCASAAYRLRKLHGKVAPRDTCSFCGHLLPVKVGR